MRSWMSPAGVARSRSRLPLRCPRRWSVRSWRSAPMAAAASASIRACSPWRTSSGMSSPAEAPLSNCASSVAAESEMGMVWFSGWRWFSNQGHRPAHPFPRKGTEEETVSTGYAGADPQHLHHLAGRPRQVRWRMERCAIIYWSRTTQAMSAEEQLKVFWEAIQADTGLRQKLQGVTEPDAVAAIAKEAGFSISAEEIKKAQ